MKNVNLENVSEAQEFEKVVPGGYVCGITAVEDFPDKEYLLISFDIAEGKLKNYYYELNKAKNFWGGTFIKSYKDKALPFFKGFITAVEKSNTGYKFNYDESTLRRKLFGAVIGEEEYEANDGSIKVRAKVVEIHSVDKIRKGDFKVPALKKLSGSQSQTTQNVNQSYGDLSDFEEILNDGDVPF